MKLLESFFTSGAGLTLVAIMMVLAVIGIIAFLLYKTRQKKWAKYPPPAVCAVFGRNAGFR